MLFAVYPVLQLFAYNMSELNFFRIVFDHCFGTKYGRLPDKSYFSTDDKPYRFIPVPMAGPLTHRTDSVP